MSHWCRHYPKGGMGDNTHCTLGIDMQSLGDRTVVPHAFPCFTVGAEHLCAKYEGYSQAEIDAEEKELAAIFQKFEDFETRKTEDCPHCGQHVERLEQVGRCAYARPCNCRAFQGRVPVVWRT